MPEEMTMPRTTTAAARPTNNQRDDGPDGTGAGCCVSVWITSDEFSSMVFIVCLPLHSSRSGVNRFVFRGCERLCIRRSGPAVEEGKHGRDKDQCGHRGAQQTSNDSAAERCILLTSITEPERHRDHSDNHGQSRHDDRPESSGPCFDCGNDRISM